MVGITDFAQSQLGDIVFVDVPTVGETLAAGDVFGSIEAVKTVSDAFLPVGGEIVEFNPAVDADPSVVNKDAYGGESQDFGPGRLRRSAHSGKVRRTDRIRGAGERAAFHKETGGGSVSARCAEREKAQANDPFRSAGSDRPGEAGFVQTPA